MPDICGGHAIATNGAMLAGSMLLTPFTPPKAILDQNGRPAVADVKEGDLWYFPAGLPHSLQGLDPDGAEFVLAFDNGESSEFNTLLVSDWIAHTPPEVLAKNFGVPQEAFKDIPLHNKWIYQSNIAAPPLATVEAQIAAAAGKPPNPFVFRLADMRPNQETKSGTVRIADSTNFLVSKTIAATQVTVKSGGLRDMHWHPNADEWTYIIKGTARMTVFNTGPAAITANFHAGDIGYVKKGLGQPRSVGGCPVSQEPTGRRPGLIALGSARHIRAFAGYFGAAQNVWFVHAGMRLAEVRFVPLVEMSEDVDQDELRDGGQ